MSKKRNLPIKTPNRKNKPAFGELAKQGVIWWENLTNNENSLIPYLRAANNIVTYYLYLNNQKKARELSDLYSAFIEKEAKNHKVAGEYNRTEAFFQAALFRSLSNKVEEADIMWQDFIRFRHDRYPHNQVLKDRTYHIWIYEAYALAKLSQYFETLELSNKGIQNLASEKAKRSERGWGALDMGLGTILESLASYQLESTQARKERAQKALLEYKELGLKYGRLNNYPLIFDLQFSYPDVFTPVLPGSDPDKD